MASCSSSYQLLDADENCEINPLEDDDDEDDVITVESDHTIHSEPDVFEVEKIVGVSKQGVSHWRSRSMNWMNEWTIRLSQ